MIRKRTAGLITARPRRSRTLPEGFEMSARIDEAHVSGRWRSVQVKIEIVAGVNRGG